MDIHKTLQDIGLSENQTIIYLALLELGSATAGEITNKSHVNRTNVYDALERLLEKGLVSYVIQANKKYFEAKDPNSLISFLEFKEKNIRNKKSNLKKILPEIRAKRALNKEPQEATIYKGKRGLQSITEEIIKEAKELLVFGAEGNFKEIFKHYFDQWHLKRKQAKIKLKIIYNKDLKRSFPYSEIRINKNMDKTPATTWIYNDKIVIVVWSKEPLATMIRSKEVVESYKSVFNQMWKESEKK
jgi:sugar-specific transcriptional regulator TrmB